MQEGDAVERRLKQRAFLDAAAGGDLKGVDAWISAGGDVDATMGEGWTALHYAVANSRMDVVRRLLREESIDLNATTMLGTSALTLALSRKNNSLVTLLLRNGASRATISNELWQEVEIATWIRTDVRIMLSPEWSVVWSPTLHRHFPPSEREKCRLVVYANVLVMRQCEKQQSNDLLTSTSSLAVVGWKDEAMLRFWRLVAALTGSFGADEDPVRWRYLPQSLVYHILEYAVFLW